MFIAVNAHKRPSPFGGAEGGCGLPFKQFPLLRTERELLAVPVYKHVAPNGAKSDW